MKTNQQKLETVLTIEPSYQTLPFYRKERVLRLLIKWAIKEYCKTLFKKLKWKD
jgi:hypothetical protein